MLSIQGLTVVYSESDDPSLVEATFSADPGETIVCVGLSGAGKSTLLAAVAGLIAYTGHIRLFGREVSVLARKDPRRLHATTGVAIQFPERSFFAGTGWEELSFTPSLLKMTARERDEAVQFGAALADLRPALLDRSPFSLSGGEKRRLALACAAAHRPSLILLDEPDAGLDWQAKGHVSRMIRQLQSQGSTVIAATHDAAWAHQWADRCLVLHGGRIVADSPLKELLDRGSDPLIPGGVPFTEWLPDGGEAWTFYKALEAGDRGRLGDPYRNPMQFYEEVRALVTGKGGEPPCPR